MGNNGEGYSGSGGIGRVLNGRYQLISVVGSGGMAHVYKARDNVLGRVVAVKVLRDQYAGDEQFVARFRREAQSAANLAHPNIVNVYDVGQDGDLYYIVMEYINGESLKEYLQRTAPVPINKAVAIAVQILAGVEYAHRSGLIHRDIKPQNVLITPDGTIKVTDFGIAKSVSDLGLTEAGLALGTAHYFSPEQAKGERVVPQSDIYAVGVTLFEMLAGRLPFESENVMGLAFKHITEDAPSVRNFNPSVPPRLEAIITKALAKDPQQRFGSAAEMEKALRAMQAGGRQATMEVPVAQVNMQGGNKNRGGRANVPTAQARSGTGRLQGSQTSTFRPGQGPRGTYAIGGAGAGGGTIATTRQVGNALGAPTSMAVAPTLRADTGGSGCTIAAIALITIGVLALLAGGVIFFGPKLPSIFSPDMVIPSPTATPIIPTATPTFTPVPPTNTPTVTPTNTATPTATPVSVAVPKLVGLRIQDAVTLARQSGLVVVQLDTIESEQWPQGVVAQQNPNNNTLLKKTSVIAVRVSRGPPPFKMPSLANTDPAAAETVLTGTGLTVTVRYEGSATIPKGVVTRTDPPAETNVKPGDRIVLYISRGPTARIPDLHGMENSDLATQRLESLNLVVGTITEASDPTNSVPPGAVLSTDPPAGTEVEQNSVVNITISTRGP